MNIKVIIIGCGYIGKRIAALEQSAGAHVQALARSSISAQRLEQSGIESVFGDLDKPNSLSSLPTADTLIYYLAPPPPVGRLDTRMANFVRSVQETKLPWRVVLISTSGVYGDCQGDWVTEERPPAPQVDRARRRLSAENILRQWGKTHGVGIEMLRVPGIYGPGRLPERRLRQGLPVLRESDSPFSNRIHADDLARACLAAAQCGSPDTVYNVSDGNPTTMTDFFFRVADLLAIPRPPALSLAEAQERLSPDMLSYLRESKRLDNRRMREELRVELEFPDLARGLPACLEAPDPPALK